MLRLGLAESQTYFPYLTHNSGEALLAASQEKFGLAIIDTEIPGPSFHELWKDLKTMQPDMQLVLIFPEAEEEYPSLDGIAPLGCVDHLLYMPEFLELIDSAFPTVEESISTPEIELAYPETQNQEILPAQHQNYDADWLEDPHIASAHLEKQLPLCSAKAAMIARFDKVLAYSDQLEVSAAQEIANRFTRYWDKDSKNSDLVRFIHLGPMNNAYLLYVTALVNEAVLAALYQPDTPLSQPHKQISKLAQVLLSAAPVTPQNDTGSLKMEFIDVEDDVFSQRMRMVTGSLSLAKTETPDTDEEFLEEEYEDTDDLTDEGFDPDQFHLEELLSRMPSPDPDTPDPFERTAPIETHREPDIPRDAVESLRFSWDLDSDAVDEPETPLQTTSKREPSPWESDGSLDIPQPKAKENEEDQAFPWKPGTGDLASPKAPDQNTWKRQLSPWETDGSLDIPQPKAKENEEDQAFPWKSSTGDLASSKVPDQNSRDREPYPWEMEDSSPQEPVTRSQGTIERQPYPWEAETDHKNEPEATSQDAVENLRYPWETGTGDLEQASDRELEEANTLPQNSDPFTSQQDSVESLRYPWESDTGSLEEKSASELNKPDKISGNTDPFITQDAIKNLRNPWKSDTGSLKEESDSDLNPPEDLPHKTGPFIAQDAVESLRDPWDTHTAHLTPPSEDIEETETSEQDAVESLRSPWNKSTASLSETPPNGHNEINEDDFEPLPDFTDLETASESPLGNGWHKEEEPQENETVDGENDGDSKAGTSPLKHPANRVQSEEEAVEDEKYADCVYTYTTFVTPLLKRHALTRELAQILAKSMNTVCENNHWKLLNMTARPSGMLWTARIPPNVTTGQMVKIIREETSEMLYEVHPRLKYEALSENFWAANYLVVSGNDAPDDNSIKEFLQRIHQINRSNGSRH